MKNTDFILSNADINQLTFENPEKYETVYVNSFPIDKTPSANIILADASYMNILQSDIDTSLNINNTLFFDNIDKSYKKTLKHLNTSNASYQVIQTNPKLTGNIKVVVDSKNNLFIDTFKITDTLSKDKYRKVPISYRDYYGKNIMAIFKNVPSDDIYKISPKCYDMFTTTTDMGAQYVDTYRCGARLNNDKLYSENFSLLAPLYINNVLPDFFVIFKVKGVVDLSDSTSIMNYLIQHGEQLACFDIRLNSKLGTYIRNIQKQADNFENDFYVSRTDNSPHQITAISIDKGVVAKQYENRNEKPYYEQNSNVEYCNYFTSMFETKRMVNSRLINFEFMFDDNTDVEQFETNTYFGLYICTNELNSNIFVDTDEKGNIVFKDENFKDASLSTAIDSLKTSNDIIYGYTSKDWFRRETTNNASSILNDLIKKEGQNLLITDGIRSEETAQKSFLSLTIRKKFEAGEHLKLVLTTKLITHNDYVYEIIFSDCKLYKDSIVSNPIVTYNKDYKKTIVVHRIACYTSEESVQQQIKNIKKAFNALNSENISILYNNENTITFGYNDNNEGTEHEAYFQYMSNKSYLTDYNKSKFVYFGKYVSKLFIINPLEKGIFEDEYNGVFMPLNFEITGKRETSIIKFINIPNGTIPFEINSKTILLNDKNLSDTLLVAFDNAKNVEKLNKFTINQIVNDAVINEEKVNIINSYRHANAELLLLTENICGNAENGDIYLYYPYYINYVICGMLNVKNLDFDVNSNDIQYYIDIDSSSMDKPSDIITSKYDSNRKYDITPLISSKCNWVTTGVFKKDSSLYNTEMLNNGNDTSLCDEIYKSLNISNSSNYRERLLNNEINIDDLIYSLNDSSENSVYHINTYSISNNKIEFIYNDARYSLLINNLELLSSKDISNCNLYICNSNEAHQEYGWEIFIDKQNYNILLIRYNSANITKKRKILQTKNDPVDTFYDILEFNIAEKTHDLIIDGSGVTVTPQNISISLDKKTTYYAILNSEHFSILSNDVSANVTSNNLTLKNLSFTNNYFAPTGKSTVSKNIDIFPVSENITCYLFCTAVDNTNMPLADNTFIPNIDEITSSNIGVFIKNESKYKEYTKLSPIAFNKIDDQNDSSASSLNQTTYTNATYDIFEYDKIDNDDIIISKYNNIKLSSVNPIHYLWYTKYTDNTSYCLDFVKNTNANLNLTNAISSSYIENYNTLKSSLSSDFYKKYVRVKAETPTEAVFDINGTKSGVLKTTFFNSLGVLMKNYKIHNIEISSWFNTFVKDECIYFNITYSLIQKILHSVGFSKLWSQLRIKDENTKINFIFKSILPYIPLSANNEITVYTSQKNNYDNLYSDSLNNNMTINKNIKAEIVSEKDNLYVKLTPSKTENNKYYIKYNISL